VGSFGKDVEELDFSVANISQGADKEWCVGAFVGEPIVNHCGCVGN
jgi:hypothetical protein